MMTDKLFNIEREEKYWLTPPDIYKELDNEFHFDFDPCPYPKPQGFNGINTEWGISNFVNPPFHRYNGIGPTAFVRKAIQESRNGKQTVLLLPTQSYINLLLESGAELRSMGRIRWLHAETKIPSKSPSPITAFVLRNNKKGI
jgi:hypothetical protein